MALVHHFACGWPFFSQSEDPFRFLSKYWSNHLVAMEDGRFRVTRLFDRDRRAKFDEGRRTTETDFAAILRNKELNLKEHDICMIVPEPKYGPRGICSDNWLNDTHVHAYTVLITKRLNDLGARERAVILDPLFIRNLTHFPLLCGTKVRAVPRKARDKPRRRFRFDSPSRYGLSLEFGCCGFWTHPKRPKPDLFF